MMQNLLFITWDVNPEMFTIPIINWPVRWYGLMFAAAFLSSQVVVGHIFKTEQRPAKYLDIITIYIIAGTVIGARLGHCLFYGPQFDIVDASGRVLQEGYISHPLNILKIWEGGLASHGGAVGIITAMLLYCRKTGEGVWWLFDRIVIVVPLAGMCIRIGNLFNSEILGKPTTLPWGFKFLRGEEDARQMVFQGADAIPARHPSQLYEAIYCVFLFLLMFYLWKYKRQILPQGFMFGLFCVLLFTSRFLMEFLKETQVDWEKGLEFNMGQWLSIPFVLGGIFIMIYSYQKQKRSLE